MSDPHTLGIVVSGLLGIVSEAALKGSVGEAAKDAYGALKHRISEWLDHDIQALELNPTSPLRRAIIAETIDALPSEQQEMIRTLAIELATALKGTEVVGIDVGALKAAEISLGTITVSQGVGIRAESITTTGHFELKKLKVGEHSGKAGR